GAIDEALAVSLSRLMFDGPEDELTATHNAQPAILAHTVAVFAVVGPATPGPAVAAAGHSLGEYSAYVTAGALPATDAAALVRRRGELMHQAGTARPGPMAAVRARRLLADQLTAPVRWVACMQRAADLADAGESTRFIEIGPGNALAGLLRRIVAGATVVSLGTADEVAKFLEAA